MKFKFVMPCVLGSSLLSACNGALPSGQPASSSSVQEQSVLARTGSPVTASGVTPAAVTQEGTLASGSEIKTGESMPLYTQIHNIFHLTLGTDGNLVLSESVRSPGSPPVMLWASNTTSGRVLRMQADGNLVLYDGQNKALWATGTAGHAGSVLSMLPDGSMSVNQSSVVRWSSSSVLNQELASPAYLATFPRVAASSGQSWVGSPSSWTQLSISSGNLVLSTNPSHSSGPWTALWSTGTTTGSVLRMQPDGNLVLYDAAGKALWDTGTWGHRGLFLSVSENGVMTLAGCSASGSGYLNTTGASGCPVGKSVPVWTLRPHTAS